MAKTDLKFTTQLKSKPQWRVGVVTSRFNQNVTDKLNSGATKQLQKMGFSNAQIIQTSVPGAYEIPLAAKWLLEQGCDGVIALGAVIRGETTHYDYVCAAVERGCTQVQLDSGCPVVFGVLTTENLEQAMARVGGAHGHKGVEAAQVLVEMLLLKANLSSFKNMNKKQKQKKEKKSWPQITQSL